MHENRNSVLYDFGATQAPVHISIGSVKKHLLLDGLFFLFQPKIEFILYY